MSRKCECCKREISDVEQLFHMEISQGGSMEHILDMCEDCYTQVLNIIDNAEQWRLKRL